MMDKRRKNGLSLRNLLSNQKHLVIVVGREIVDLPRQVHRKNGRRVRKAVILWFLF